MSVEVIVEAPDWDALDLQALADRAEAAALGRLGLDAAACEIALLACDDARIAALNAQFRGKLTPTNVLSWPAEDLAPTRPGDPPAAPEAEELGDIALAWGVCQAEAAAAGKPLEHHVTHLLVHGILHLLGHDHETEPDAARMERLETEILATLGMPDPY